MQYCNALFAPQQQLRGTTAVDKNSKLYSVATISTHTRSVGQLEAFVGDHSCSLLSATIKHVLHTRGRIMKLTARQQLQVVKLWIRDALNRDN